MGRLSIGMRDQTSPSRSAFATAPPRGLVEKNGVTCIRGRRKIVSGRRIVYRSGMRLDLSRWILLLPALYLSTSSLRGEEIWVDGERGDDSSLGTREQPLATIKAGLERLQPGVTLHILPQEKPWPTDIRITRSGTAEEPIVIDGHGSLASGRREVPLEEWTRNEDGSYQRPLPNNAWGMASHWEGGFPLVWFDGEAGKNVTSREELVSGSYFLYKNRAEQRTDPLHNTLFIRPPEVVNGDSVRIETITREGGIFVGGDHVVVKNFVVEYGGRDGYATHRNTGVVFENVEARYFMDQGMSHHGAEVVVRDSWFHHNAGAGIVDVYSEAKVTYENCRIEFDTWRGGVEFHSGEFQMIGCEIRANPQKGITVTKGATLLLRDSLVEGGGQEKEGLVGIKLGEGSALRVMNTTIRGFSTALEATINAQTELTVDSCWFEGNDRHLDFSEMHRKGRAAFSAEDRVTLKKNHFEAAGFRHVLKRESDTGWRVETDMFTATQYDAFSARWGGDPTSSSED